MWSPEGAFAGGGNMYENHTSQTLLVTAIVHNLEEGDKGVIILVPSSEVPVRVRAGESMAFTSVIEAGRAISSDPNSGKCRFSLLVQKM